MKSRHWIKGAIKHPGAEKRAAAAAGMSTHAFMEAHKGDSGTSGRRARLGLTLSKMTDGGLVIGGMRRGQFAPVPGGDNDKDDRKVVRGNIPGVDGAVRKNAAPARMTASSSAPQMADGGMVQHREMKGQYAHGGVVHNLKTPTGPKTLSAAARERFARNSKGH